MTKRRGTVVYDFEEPTRPAELATALGFGRLSEARADRIATTHLNMDEGAMDRRILVVDDSELVCQQLSQLLAHSGRQITVAPDGCHGMIALERMFPRNKCRLFWLPQIASTKGAPE